MHSSTERRDYIGHSCTPQRPCNRWRTCSHCARLRQKAWADKAEAMAAAHGPLLAGRLTPAEQSAAAIRAARDKLAGMLRNSAGIWSIGAGEQFGKLHIHTLTPAASAPIISAHLDYLSPIRTSARAVAAYMVNPAGQPSAEVFRGKLVGSWGRVGDLVLSSNRPEHVVLQAAEAERRLLSPAEVEERAAGWFRVPDGYVRGEPVRPERTRAEYAEIARRNLSKLYASFGAGQVVSV